MTKDELKHKLLNNKFISFIILGKNLMISTEKVLLDNGWLWADGSSEPYIKNNRWEFQDKINIVLYSNFTPSSQLPKKISYSSYLPDPLINDTDVLVTEEIIKYIDYVFHPVPNYSPRKIIKDT